MRPTRLAEVDGHLWPYRDQSPLVDHRGGFGLLKMSRRNVVVVHFQRSRSRHISEAEQALSLDIRLFAVHNRCYRLQEGGGANGIPSKGSCSQNAFLYCTSMLYAFTDQC